MDINPEASFYEAFWRQMICSNTLFILRAGDVSLLPPRCTSGSNFDQFCENVRAACTLSNICFENVSYVSARTVLSLVSERM